MKLLSKNRDFYDLCRKYKYYYNAYKEIERMKKIYWSKFIQEAYKDAKNELDNIENEIIQLILMELVNEPSKIEIKRNDKQCGINYHVVVYDNYFVEKMKEYVNNMNRSFYNNEAWD